MSQYFIVSGPEPADRTMRCGDIMKRGSISIKAVTTICKGDPVTVYAEVNFRDGQAYIGNSAYVDMLGL